MPISNEHIGTDTAMGAQLIAEGATFKTWAPSAASVYVCGEFNQWERNDDSLLIRDANGYWAGFVPGLHEFTEYKFYVLGPAGEGFKRDPYARELTRNWPNSNCILRSPEFPWCESNFKRPEFSDIVLYQLHVGTYDAVNWPPQGGTFLDVVNRIEHLSELGVNCLQLLPIQEFMSTFSMGYNGTDYYSPEMDFSIPEEALGPYLSSVNALLASKGEVAVGIETLRGSVNQLKMLINLCHLYGIAVIFDVVYNHAGGGFDPESIYFYDFQAQGTNNNSLYFLDRGHAGGLVFALWKREVRQYLIDNAVFLMREYRIDGFRYDQVSVLVEENHHHGWPFCQDLTNTLKFLFPDAIDIAEYWPTDPYIVRRSEEGGAGFDAALHDGLRDSIRELISEASFPGNHPLDFGTLANRMRAEGFPNAWQAVQCIENHDEVYLSRGARIPRLADGLNPRSWYARSRSRVALGLLMTAPGIPMLFMGQEFLEEKQWSDYLPDHADKLIHWAGLDTNGTGFDRHSADFFTFAAAIIRLRRDSGALRSEGYQAIHANPSARVFAFQRWDDNGAVVVVVASLSDITHYNYELGFPQWGYWREVFNSDYYDHFPNPLTTGNGGGVDAVGHGMHGMPASAGLTLPANSILAFTRSS